MGWKGLLESVEDQVSIGAALNTPIWKRSLSSELELGLQLLSPAQWLNMQAPPVKPS